MGRKSSLDVLPQEVRRWLERALTERNFTGYAELEELLKDKGFVITRSSLQRFGYKMEQQLARVRAATEAARLMAREAEDDSDDRSGGLMALIQTEMIDIFMRLKAVEGDDPKENEKRTKLLAIASKNIATLTRASVSLKKFQLDVRDKLDAKMDELERQAKGGDGRLSLETLKLVREQIYGIVS